MPPQLPQWRASPSSVALRWEHRLGGGVQAQGAPTTWGSCGWTRPGAHDRWRGASSGQRRSRLWARRWVALPGRPAPNLLRGGRLSARLGERGAPLSPRAPCVLGRISLGEPTPHLNVRLSFTCPCVPHGDSSRRVGWGGNKVFPSWSGRGRAGAGPSRPQTPWLDCARGHPGALLSVGASPGAGRRLPLPALSHPLPSGRPLPRLPRAPARRLRPSRAGVAAVPGCPRLPPRAPWPHSSLGAPRGERGTAREAEAGALGTPALPTCRRPRLREPKRRERQGPGGRRRGGRRSSATPVTSGAARPPFLPFPLCFPPPSPLGEGKVAVAAPCPGRSESRGRKWRTSR